MYTKWMALFSCLWGTIPLGTLATDGHGMRGDPTVFHSFRLETDIGVGREGANIRWEFDGWIGGDTQKLWFKSEGEVLDGETHQGEFWAMYSRNITDFWDAQLGIREDIKPHSTPYAIVGFEGMAPYFFDTEAHLFISDEGDVSVRIRAEKDFLMTQALILKPHIEINMFMQDVTDQNVGAGVAASEFGLQTRYEFTRTCAPYLDVRYERTWGETASIARREHESTDDFITSLGLRLMF
ncbi:MAG: copper resistance protein B [Alphaproteobacteria bacterium]|nr:copper resistance protein B [Alphaproteobacteria bacterium]